MRKSAGHAPAGSEKSSQIFIVRDGNPNSNQPIVRNTFVHVDNCHVDLCNSNHYRYIHASLTNHLLLHKGMLPLEMLCNLSRIEALCAQIKVKALLAFHNLSFDLLFTSIALCYLFIRYVGI